MANIRITGIQMEVGETKKENLPKILDAIKKNADSDIIVFPELALTGSNDEFGDAPTAEAWAQIAEACRISYTTGIFGTGSRANGNTYIQARIYGHDGELIGNQNKLVPTQEERTWCRPGESLNTFNTHGIHFGCLVGNDLWVAPGKGPYPDPRLSMQLTKKGIDIIFHLANTGTDIQYTDFYYANLQLRAREARIPIVTVNAAKGNKVITSPTGIVDADGNWLVKCDPVGEQKFSYNLDVITE